MTRLALRSALLFALVLTATPRARAADPEVKQAVKTFERHAKEPFEQDRRAGALRALARIGGPEAAAAALPAFTDPFEHLADRAVSAWITMVKGDRAEETVAWLARKGLASREPAVRQGAATALGFATCPGAGDALARRIHKEKEPLVLVALLHAWAKTEARSSFRIVDLLRHRDGRVVLATVEALRDRDLLLTIPPGWHDKAFDHKAPRARAAALLAYVATGALRGERATTVLADRDEIPRVALAEALAHETESLPWDPIGRELLRSLLADASWRVRARAIRSVVSQWRADGVPLLIAKLDSEDGRLRLDLADALAALTGKALGPDAELWRSWWEAQGDMFDPGPRPRGGRPRTPKSEPAGETRTTTFFRLPVVSKRVAFLLDCSGSMRDPAIGDDEGLTKMDLAAKELARTLAELDATVRFDVFLYRYPSEYPPRPKMTRAFRNLTPCTKAAAGKAEAWLRGQPAKGWGAFSDALDALLAEDVDTVFFLTDGRPSRGRYDRDFRLIAEFDRANRFRQVVVHTVLVGQKRADRAFLEELAEITGGHFADATRRAGRR